MHARNLWGLDLQALSTVLAELDAPAYHASQAFRWMYGRRQLDCSAWTDLPLGLRRRLGQETVVDPGRVVGSATADDGTIKYAIGLGDGRTIECVSMRQAGRLTLCLSSQAGCALACTFCLTGRMGLARHLSPGEIAGQVARMLPAGTEDGQPFNLVFMGMGEPLHNYDGLIGALELLTDPAGFAIPARRITVSTAGLAPQIERLAEARVRPRLAVSLNATTDELRGRLMPINRRYPLERLLAACRTFRARTGESFTFEYVLLAGVNDTPADVRRLAHIARGAKVNLIPFNPVPGELPFQPPPRRHVLAVRDELLARGVGTSIRWSRGRQARAACGQLALLPAAG